MGLASSVWAIVREQVRASSEFESSKQRVKKSIRILSVVNMVGGKLWALQADDANVRTWRETFGVEHPLHTHHEWERARIYYLRQIALNQLTDELELLKH